jgi:hypothetical protein
MNWYRGTIKNEEGKAIFSKKGKFENKEKCLEALHQRVCIDGPTEFDIIIDYRNHLSSGLGTTYSYKPLKSFYKDISKLTFTIEQI